MSCTGCYPGCTSCFGYSLTSCYSCGSSGLNTYYLEHLSNTCSDKCPPGQYISLNNLCQLCSSICATCSITPSNCTSCTNVSNFIPVYFYNFTCTNSCISGFYNDNANLNNRTCSPCLSICLTCFGPLNTNCYLCNNITILVAGFNTTKIIYKDANNTICNTSCPVGQFISTPNFCGFCFKGCGSCKINSTFCQNCSNGYFLLISQSQCLQACPLGYYGDNISKKCVVCDPMCYGCIASGNLSCTSCYTLTYLNGSSLILYKQPNSLTCKSTCPSGYFNDQINNNCQVCQNGCQICRVISSNCSSCIMFNNTNYFLYNNICVKECPLGSFPNINTFVCQNCQYFSLGSECLMTCPANYIGVIGPINQCKSCDLPNVSCSSPKGFQVKSTVSNDKKSLEHKVILQDGLSTSINQLSLLGKVSVFLTDGKERLLVTSSPLSINNILISGDRSYLIITTNLVSLNPSSSGIVVNFVAGSIISFSGVPYNVLSASIPLNNPVFIRSYISAFFTNYYYQILGIILTILSFILLTTSIFINKMIVVIDMIMLCQMIQLIGLSRVHLMPYEYFFYNVQIGFSYFQLGFIPRLFDNALSQYIQLCNQSMTLVYGSQNIILNFGILILIIATIHIFFFLAQFKFNGGNKQQIKAYHQLVTMIWLVILVFGSVHQLISLQYNDVNASNPIYILSLLISLIIIFFYSYLVYYYFQIPLPQLINIFRCLALIILPFSRNMSFLTYNTLQLTFLVYEWHTDNITINKRNNNTFQRIIFTIVINSCILQVSYIQLIITLSLSFTIFISRRVYLLITQIQLILSDAQQVPQKLDNSKIQQNYTSFISPFKQVQQKHEQLSQSKELNKNMQKNSQSYQTIDLNLIQPSLQQTKKNVPQTPFIFEEELQETRNYSKQQTRRKKGKKLSPLIVQQNISNLQLKNIQSIEIKPQEQVILIQLNEQQNLSNI